jgi:hypothetical protein
MYGNSLKSQQEEELNQSKTSNVDLLEDILNDRDCDSSVDDVSVVSKTESRV